MIEALKFIEVQKSTKLFNLSVLETKLDIPRGLISKHIRGVQFLKKTHLESLDRYIKESILVNKYYLKKSNRELIIKHTK